MQVSAIQGNVTLNSGGGDVGISAIGGAADLLTGGGNVTASDLGGILTFTTSGGDVDGSGLFSPHVTMSTGASWPAPAAATSPCTRAGSAPAPPG